MTPNSKQIHNNNNTNSTTDTLMGLSTIINENNEPFVDHTDDDDETVVASNVQDTKEIKISNGRYDDDEETVVASNVQVKAKLMEVRIDDNDDEITSGISTYDSYEIAKQHHHWQHQQQQHREQKEIGDIREEFDDINLLEGGGGGGGNNDSHDENNSNSNIETTFVAAPPPTLEELSNEEFLDDHRDGKDENGSDTSSEEDDKEDIFVNSLDTIQEGEEEDDNDEEGEEKEQIQLTGEREGEELSSRVAPLENNYKQQAPSQTQNLSTNLTTTIENDHRQQAERKTSTEATVTFQEPDNGRAADASPQLQRQNNDERPTTKGIIKKMDGNINNNSCSGVNINNEETLKRKKLLQDRINQQKLRVSEEIVKEQYIIEQKQQELHHRRDEERQILDRTIKKQESELYLQHGLSENDIDLDDHGGEYDDAADNNDDDDNGNESVEGEEDGDESEEGAEENASKINNNNKPDFFNFADDFVRVHNRIFGGSNRKLMSDEDNKETKNSNDRDTETTYDSDDVSNKSNNGNGDEEEAEEITPTKQIEELSNEKSKQEERIGELETEVINLKLEVATTKSNEDISKLENRRLQEEIERMYDICQQLQKENEALKKEAQVVAAAAAQQQQDQDGLVLHPNHITSATDEPNRKVNSMHNRHRPVERRGSFSAGIMNDEEILPSSHHSLLVDEGLAQAGAEEEQEEYICAMDMDEDDNYGAMTDLILDHNSNHDIDERYSTNTTGNNNNDMKSFNHQIHSNNGNNSNNNPKLNLFAFLTNNSNHSNNDNGSFESNEQRFSAGNSASTGIVDIVNSDSSISNANHLLGGRSYRPIRRSSVDGGDIRTASNDALVGSRSERLMRRSSLTLSHDASLHEGGGDNNASSRVSDNDNCSDSDGKSPMNTPFRWSLKFPFIGGDNDSSSSASSAGEQQKEKDGTDNGNRVSNDLNSVGRLGRMASLGSIGLGNSTRGIVPVDESMNDVKSKSERQLRVNTADSTVGERGSTAMILGDSFHDIGLDNDENGDIDPIIDDRLNPSCYQLDPQHACRLMH